MQRRGKLKKRSASRTQRRHELKKGESLAFSDDLNQKKESWYRLKSCHP